MLVALITSILMTHTQAADLGYRYKEGKCVNSEGKEGLNVSYFGQCSDFRLVGLSNLSLDGLDFSGSRFDGAKLERVNFAGSTFTDVSFEKAILSGSELTEAKLIRTLFKGAILKNVNFSEAQIQAPIFDEADFSGGTYSFFTCEGCSFKKAIFEGAVLDNADLSGSDLTGANFSSSNLRDADLSKASIAGANFNKAQLTQTNLKDSKVPSSDFRKAKLDKADLRGAVFDKSDLRSTMIQDCKVEKATFKEAVYNKKTVMPFSDAEARSMGMIAGKLEGFAELNDRTYHKILVEENLSDANILKACQDEGLETPCTDAPNTGYADNKCLDVGWRENGYPMYTLSQAVCGAGMYPNACEAFNDVFIYMGEKYQGGCGVVEGSWCASGNDYKGKYALCVE